MITIKKQLRTVYDAMKDTTSKDMLEYYTGYVNGLIMGMLSTDIITIEHYKKYHNLINKTYEKKWMEVKRV